MKARASKQQKLDDLALVSPHDLPSNLEEPSAASASDKPPSLLSSDEGTASSPSELCDVSEEALLEEHIQDWTSSLSRDDLMSLSMTLYYSLRQRGMNLGEVAECIGSVIGRSEQIVREWKTVFFANGGTFLGSLRGKYQRQSILWENEELNEAATDYVRSNAVVKGKPNMTALSFCRWKAFSLTASLILGIPEKLVYKQLEVVEYGPLYLSILVVIYHFLSVTYIMYV
jgi:hypothetical protein